MKLTLSKYQNQIKTLQEMKRPISHECSCENLQQNINKLNQTLYKRIYRAWPSGLISGMQSWFNIWKLVNVTTKEERYDCISRHWKSIRQNQRSSHHKIILGKLGIKNNFFNLSVTAIKKLLKRDCTPCLIEIVHFPSKIRNKARMSWLSPPSQCYAESLC